MLWKRWKPNFKWLLLLLFLKDQSSKRLFSLVCLLFLPWLPINLFDVRIFHSYYPQLCPVKVFLKSLFGTKVMGQSKGTSIKCGFVNGITIIIIEHYGCLILLHLQPVTITSCLADKSKLQMFDRNKLLLLRTLANEDTNSRSPQCPLYRKLTVPLWILLRDLVAVIFGRKRTLILNPTFIAHRIFKFSLHSKGRSVGLTTLKESAHRPTSNTGVRCNYKGKMKLLLNFLLTRFLTATQTRIRSSPTYSIQSSSLASFGFYQRPGTSIYQWEQSSTNVTVTWVYGHYCTLFLTGLDPQANQFSWGLASFVQEW